MCRMTIAKVAIDAALDRLFDYAVPSRWQEQAVPGARVRVPFGRREATGYIVELVAGQGGEVGGREAGKAEVAQDAAAGSSATPPELPGLESVAREPAARQFLLKEISAVEGEQFILPPLLSWHSGLHTTTRHRWSVACRRSCRHRCGARHVYGNDSSSKRCRVAHEVRPNKRRAERQKKVMKLTLLR